MGRTLIFLLLLCAVWSEDPLESELSKTDEVKLQDVVVLVLTQPHSHHVHRAQLFRKHFDDQLTDIAETERPELVLTHEQWPELQGAWAVFPLLSQLAEKYGEKKWILICEEDTRIDVQELPAVLELYNPTDDLFVGRALRDQQPTIIHHFAFINDPSSFSYPDFAAGVVVSVPLLKRLAAAWSENASPEMQFSIDPKYEFAKYIWDKLEIRLTPVCEFCGHKKSDLCQCVTWQSTTFPIHCGPPVESGEVFVAVKTCSKFHQDRVKVVKATWGKETELIEYYSDEEDSSIPTINLGVPNTERGHCGKTSAILRHIANSERLASVPWFLIADDDTIINLELLRRLLACYSTEQPVFLGERYGYAVAQGYGYNYITGGGGMVFNRVAVELLAKEFTCPTDDSPDDMLLGMFFASRGIPITHSKYFHQARPEDYSKEFLENQIPVSFHKHWNNNPYEVYEQLKDFTLPEPSAASHDEL